MSSSQNQNQNQDQILFCLSVGFLFAVAASRANLVWRPEGYSRLRIEDAPVSLAQDEESRAPGVFETFGVNEYSLQLAGLAPEPESLFDGMLRVMYWLTLSVNPNPLYTSDDLLRMYEVDSYLGRGPVAFPMVFPEAHPVAHPVAFIEDAPNTMLDETPILGYSFEPVAMSMESPGADATDDRALENNTPPFSMVISNDGGISFETAAPLPGSFVFNTGSSRIESVPPETLGSIYDLD